MASKTIEERKWREAGHLGEELKEEKYFLKNRKEGNEERELNWTNCKKKEIMGLQQKAQVHVVQVESEVEDGDNRLTTNKCRPKRRK